MSVEPPATGTNSSSPLAAAISLLSIGALLVALARRRRRTIWAFRDKGLPAIGGIRCSNSASGLEPLRIEGMQASFEDHLMFDGA
jgi:LPXTG-motif cell wall-anchored protein